MTKFVISLDFELFWGVADSRTISQYGRNIDGVWDAVPAMLAMFRAHNVRVTWATVGMLMCRDYKQWQAMKSALLPTYQRQECSTYLLDKFAADHPRLFFARALVEEIAATPGQEIASHTYSHFYTEEPGTTVEQFSADLAASQAIAAELGIRQKSIVFPRNQIRPAYKRALADAGFSVYRSNPAHVLYRSGHRPPFGVVGRAIRLADSWLPLSGQHAGCAIDDEGVTAVPASLFVRPWTTEARKVEFLKMARLKRAMTSAAQAGGICHLWWHPHNFGINLQQNLQLLKMLLEHFEVLRDRYGMESSTMGEFRPTHSTAGGI